MKLIDIILNFLKSLFKKPDSNGNCPECEVKDACQTIDKNKKYAVIVGMETSRYGVCPGADRDSNTMNAMISQYVDSSHIVRLNNKQATVSAFRKALTDQIAKVPEDGLLILTYSGHGGQYNKSSSAKDEVDGKDEFLCLYDGALIDNDLWTMFGECKGRILFIVDACHSSTMFRLPSEEVDDALDEAENRLPLDNAFMSKFENARSVIRLLCISGCGEETISWGDAQNGGVLTSSMKRAYNKCLTYREWWNKFKVDPAFKKVKQVPYCTKIGGFDLNAKVFN